MAISRKSKRRLGLSLQYVVLASIGSVLILTTNWPKIQKNFFSVEIAVQMFPQILTIALRNTLIYSLLGFAFGLTLGLLLALMRTTGNRFYRWLAIAYIEVFRGLPALLVLFAVGYGVPIAYGQQFPGGTTGAVAIGIGVISAAYMAETIRAGLQAVPRGQVEAAKSLGMSTFATLRTIVIPQAFRIIIPPMTNEFITLVKDSSLVYVLGVSTTTLELTKFGRNNLDQFVNVTPLVVVGLCYLAITFPLARLVDYLEQKQVRTRW